ncbi:hypothetical protein X943_002675 [Babesia divergens]|uniref:Uncharacterized protein n=1 Tax=Babesia divergens TaxID=32595 RepID=A0AAD9LFR1_BABDI|nr:hypothetical protein X943_002675 [Babesia divergens]
MPPIAKSASVQRRYISPFPCLRAVRSQWFTYAEIYVRIYGWVTCSPRANYPFADMLAEEESKTICKNIALKRSAVQIRQAQDGNCISKIISLSEADVAELNWLLGGKVNWHFIKLRGYAIAIIVMLLLLAMGTIYTRTGYTRNRKGRCDERQVGEIQNFSTTWCDQNKAEKEAFLELNVNMY